MTIDYILERRFRLSRPRSAVFQFFADPRNLELVNPPSARLTWLVPPPPSLFPGAVLDFRVHVWGFPVRWKVMIREFDPPYRFIDVQLCGPFARWEHRHRFAVDEADVAGDEPKETWIEDRVTYRLPLGPLGTLAQRLGAERRLSALFDYRERRMRELLG